MDIQALDSITASTEREIQILISKVEELSNKIRHLAPSEKQECLAKVQMLKSHFNHGVNTANVFQWKVQGLSKCQ